jgi:tRNA-Thr(GGU) m(6)t(6)A37 methyltransferase TsaA
MEIRSIGTIRTPFKSGESPPIQSSKSTVKGTAELEPEYLEGLLSLDGFSHIILLYWFHRAKSPSLIVTPYLDEQAHGVFATRAPARPNPIGLSVVKLLEIKGGTIIFEGADMLDKTPLLDIKPYVPGFDHWPVTSLGWLEGRDDAQRSYESDDRFHQ